MARKSRKHLYDVDESMIEPVAVHIGFKAGAYIRVSGDDVKKRGDSLETQRNIIENHIAASPDICLKEAYIDSYTTGTTFERPGFQRMMADVECGRINCIIVKDLTRFGRNAIDAGYYLEKYFPMLGVRFIAVTDSYDSLDDTGGILLPIKNIISEAYALDIGRKCRAVQHQNIVDGRFVGRLAPYGYKKSPEDCHQLIIDEETAPIVIQMYDWAKDGISNSEIARRLSSAGIPSPSHRNYVMGFNTSNKLHGTIYWKASKIKNILADRVYIGDMIQGKRRTVNNRQFAVDESEWICVENTHKAIIERNVYDIVQDLRKELNLQMQKFKKKPMSTENVFVSKVICNKCGYPLKRKSNNFGDTYWFRCESQVKYGKDTCTVVSVREADLKTEVMTIINRFSEAILGKFIRIEHEAESSDNITGELREVNKDIDNAGRFLRSLYENMVNGLLTKSEYTQLKTDYETKIKLLSDKADEIRNRKYKLKELASEYRDLSEAVSTVVSDNKLTSEIINRLIDKIVVQPDKSFEIFFLFKDEFAEVA